MPTFPTLSARAAMRYPGETREYPALSFVADNRVTAVRSNAHAARWDEIKVQATLSAADVTLIFNFFDARKGKVETFDFVHPTLGTLTVRFKEEKLARPRLIKGTGGNPDIYELDFQLEQVY